MVSLEPKATERIEFPFDDSGNVVFHEEVEILKINFPEREATLNKMGRDMAKQFAMRHDLCKESDQQRRKYLEEKRTFECEVCHQLYSDKKYILRHMRAVHSFLL